MGHAVYAAVDARLMHLGRVELYRDLESGALISVPVLPGPDTLHYLRTRVDGDVAAVVVYQRAATN